MGICCSGRPSKGLECVYQGSLELGEGPLWCPEEQALYWVDAHGDQILSFREADAHVRVYNMGE